ncbi:MAG: GatB/YqeY domain-containing protein [Candidatus Vogelbacteria bacterium]|nr:GatB/YqeY domain-containing protein [Candidatus Vogelbacteria bacterium]
MLHQEIKNSVKTAMLEKNQVRLAVVRGLVAAFTNELVAKKRKPNEMLSDGEALAVIRRAAKQRQDSISQFRAGGREDLATQEEAELKQLETYLPAMMSTAEITKIAKTKMAELGVTDKSQSGTLMNTLMKDLKGQADGSDVKKVVEELLG